MEIIRNLSLALILIIPVCAILDLVHMFWRNAVMHINDDPSAWGGDPEWRLIGRFWDMIGEFMSAIYGLSTIICGMATIVSYSLILDAQTAQSSLSTVELVYTCFASAHVGIIFGCAFIALVLNHLRTIKRLQKGVK